MMQACRHHVTVDACNHQKKAEHHHPREADHLRMACQPVLHSKDQANPMRTVIAMVPQNQHLGKAGPIPTIHPRRIRHAWRSSRICCVTNPEK
jgi:hypothetical protein